MAKNHSPCDGVVINASIEGAAPRKRATGIVMKNVYIIDDHDAMRQSLSSLLDAFGFEVRDFENGKLFVDQVPVLEGGVALIDLQMPVIDGFGVLEKLRDWTGKFVPIIMSAREDEQLLEKIEQLGAKAFFRKPFEETVLVDRLNLEFDRHEARAQSNCP